jgi:hypothetical protein
VWFAPVDALLTHAEIVASVMLDEPVALLDKNVLAIS